MLFGSYNFSLTLDDDAILPEYKGSTFRGIFGRSLKKIVCALKNQECSKCLLREKCVYFQVFEIPGTHQRNGSTTEPGLNNNDPGTKNRIVSAPHPYVIEPPEDKRTRYYRGDLLNFSLLIFGHINEYLPYFIYAFHEMGKQGIGKGINGKRATFHLTQVTSANRVVYDGKENKIHKGPFTEELSLTPATVLPAPLRVSIHLLTPLRLKFENRLKAELPFHLLVRSMLRRISSLEEFYGAGEPKLNYRGLVAKAESVAYKPSSIHWFDWKRYSDRQDQTMLMGGMLGTASYLGDFGEFLPLMRFCEKVHIGKQTTFGLGKISAILDE